ncbi:MAG: glycosyltransferase [Anaerolineales bacterium]|jgi:glycosyltransferase involved in cell wall biosynthesis
MGKILLLGHFPPTLIKDRKIEAAHYRTWQFLQPLWEDGHEICLCVRMARVDGVPVALPDRLQVHAISSHQVGWMRALQRVHDEFDPACIVAVNFDACLMATRIKTSKPIWMDIYGEYLTIIQAASYRAQSDRGIKTSIAFMKEVLRSADIVSACSTPQKHALVGELAMAGRLKKDTFGYEFVRVILPGASSSGGGQKNSSCRAVWDALEMPEDAFVVLWCGGYNTWTDVEILFSGLEHAMAANPQVHFISVGANTYEAADNVYYRFQKMIDNSPNRERYHLLGWQPWSEIAGYYRASDVGINIDAMHYETIYGTRTRLVDMIAEGLPVITSLGSELSYLLGGYNAGLTFEIGDWRKMGKHIIALANDPERKDTLAQGASAVAKNELSFTSTTASLREWVSMPRLAPDKATRKQGEWFDAMEYRGRTLLRRFLWRVAGLEK